MGIGDLSLSPTSPLPPLLLCYGCLSVAQGWADAWRQGLSATAELRCSIGRPGRSPEALTGTPPGSVEGALPNLTTRSLAGFIRGWTYRTLSRLGELWSNDWRGGRLVYLHEPDCSPKARKIHRTTATIEIPPTTPAPKLNPPPRHPLTTILVHRFVLD